VDNSAPSSADRPTVPRMEMRVTVHRPRRRPEPVELVVRWAGQQRAADLRRALADHLQHPVEILVVDGRPVPDEAAVGGPPLLDGVSLVTAGTPASEVVEPTGPATLELVVVGGPDAGRARPLRPPGFDVGRRPGAGMRLEDPALSRVHARVEVDAAGVVVRDLGSTNGVRVDGTPRTGAVTVDTASTIVLGSSTLALRRPSGAGLPVEHPGDGTAVLTPAPRPGGDAPTVRVEAPPDPSPPTPARVPWLAALAPLPVALVLAAVLGPQLLAFALLGPVMVLGTAAGDRWSARRARRRAVTAHAADLEAARERLAAALAQERRERHRAHPDPHVVLDRVERRLVGLWSGRAATVRLGLGEVSARTEWATGGTAEPLPLSGVPVCVDLRGVRCLGIVGPEEAGRRIQDWLVGQLCAALPPHLLHLVADPPGDLGPWARVPHARAGPGRAPLRLHLSRPGADATSAAEGRQQCDVVVVTAATETDLPPCCRSVLRPAADGGHEYVTDDGSATRLVPDAVGAWWTERAARALAPLRLPDATRGPEDPVASAGVVGRSGAGPLTLAALVGSDRLTPDGIRRHWDADGPTGPTAVVGVSGGSVHRLDLARDGPHVLVGGTTGSGKSEFLRTLVTGLALESPPERLALLLVDFKGGAAFGPCVGLPHVVGLVTDLDEHLVGRLLTALRAELRRRERALAAAGAADVDELAGPRALPRLVVVVDELRALVEERPELGDGLVRLAAQGRSLGIHLVLATQRPAGTVTTEIRANVDLRVAFRVRDRSDSLDVLDAADAADIPPDRPGRAVARGGDGTLVPFQAALVAPPPPSAECLTVLDPAARGPGHHEAPGPDRSAQTTAVVEVVAAAAARRGVPPPAPPWVPPLPPLVHPGEHGVRRGVVALVDEPDLQRRDLLGWDRGVPLWRVVGPPASGRTTTLWALVSAAIADRRPDEVHVHVIGAAGSWATLRSLPHLGTWSRPGTEATTALVDHLCADLSERRTVLGTTPPPPDVVLVVDGWDQLVEADDPRAAEPVSDRVVTLLRDGAGTGLTGIVSGGRALLHSRWSGLGGRALLLGRVDPVDAAACGLRDDDLPRDPPPGRGILVPGGREAQVVLLAPEELADSTLPRTGAPAGRRPWRFRELPGTVGRAELGAVVPAAGRVGAEERPGLLLGVAGPEAAPWCWHPHVTGGHLLVTGPPRSGRTTALRALAASARLVGLPTVLVRGAARRPDEHPGAGACPVLGPDEGEVLAALRRADPRLVVLVDDVDRLDDAPVVPVLAEIAATAADDGGALAVATTTRSLTARFRGLDVEAARLGSALLLSPAGGDGDVLGVRVRPLPAGERRPGRGVVVVDGRVVPIQVLHEDENGVTGGSRSRPG
jgi:S-DNA-T family DNA segregation ATPase FtsK/SpoIIIE